MHLTVLAGLADGDFLCLDDAGQVIAAYPFSAGAPGRRHRCAAGT